MTDSPYAPPPAATTAPSTLVVTSCPEAIKSARDFTRGWLEAKGYDDDPVYVGMLVVTELVTNAHKHGSKPGDPISIQLYKSKVGPVVEVRDPSDAEPHTLPLTFDRPCGRGLAMIAELAGTWGFRHLGAGGKSVYAVMKETTA